MKYRFTFLIILLVPVFFSCKKDKGDSTCYDCTAISGGNTYNEFVCTDGVPEDKLPDQDQVGNINWTCTER